MIMEPFLQSLARHFINKYPHVADECCILFPNRRAGLFFKKYLAQQKPGPGFMPEVFTIGDFMNQISGLEPADPLELSFRIYRSYSKFVSNPESYEDFYPWGDMLISDFNDVDRYLVDAPLLFKNITDLKSIDSVFDFLDEEQKLLIKRFWKNFNEAKLSKAKETFLSIWELLNFLYQDLRTGLLKEKLGYEGLIYRIVAEQAIADTSFALPWKKILVCGFNALSASEEKLFLYLKNNSLASFFWDYDTTYINNDIHEAGRFLRRNIRLFPADADFNPGFMSLETAKPEINVYSLPSDVLQAKQLYAILENLNDADPDPAEQNGTESLNKISVILGDESLLPAVLTSLPESLDYFNITMGFPLSQTPVFSFLDSVLLLQQHSERRNKEVELFYYRDVLRVLEHQYIRSFYSEKVIPLVDSIHERNKLYLDLQEFADDALLSMIFKKVNSVNDLVDYLSTLLRYIIDAFPFESPELKLQKEYIFLINTRLNKLRNLLEENSFTVSKESFIRLFRKILQDFTIPFQGEPLRGTQIMGILESRLLDFKNVIFLSMNEGVMPANSGNYSFIPSNLRYAFGLPVKEDKDAIYAYYFYRLLQRSEGIHILYNNKTEGSSSGEPSRYIYQIEYLTNWNIKKFTTAFLVQSKKPVPISIKKSADVLSLLNNYLSPDSDKYLSPSAITNYLNCPLSFYFNNLAGIREEDEASEEIDASVFGSLYHKAMELIYKDLTGKVVTDKSIELCARSANINSSIEQAFREEFYKDRDPKRKITPEGRNIIILEIIRKLISRTLEIDRSFAPFTLVDLEKSIKNRMLMVDNIGYVRLGGKIDRLDIRDGKVHIVDYKTGKMSKEFPSLEILFNRDLWKGQENLKGILQTFLYSWLYVDENPEVEGITPGIYTTTELFNEDFSPYLKDKGINAIVEDFRFYTTEFESRLKLLLGEIFNPELTFSQTDDEKRCRYCIYNDICHRQEQ